jgi:hypothetical protein
MKNLVVILIISMGVVAGAFAQDNFENNPKVQEMRKAFYNKELQFTDAEATAFWPLFNQYQKEEKQLKKQYGTGEKIALMDDEEAKKHIQRSFEFDKKKGALKEQYFEKFAEVLPIRKVAMIEATERKFKMNVLRKVRENRQKRN